MLRRNSDHAFGGMWVFPGGKVDPEDVDPDAPEDDESAARRAAVREAWEEAGIVLDVDTLVTVSHWTPPPEAPRRFTTWFFLAEASAAAEVAIDGEEIKDHVWIEPTTALARAAAREIELAPPTWISLWTLARHNAVASFVEITRAQAPPRFATRIAKAETGPVAMWADDVAYLDGDLERPGRRHRLYMGAGPWRYEGP